MTTGVAPYGNVPHEDEYHMGQMWKRPVMVASTANINLASPGGTIDGVTMSTAPSKRFLAKDQSTGSQNGVYVWNGASTPATRAFDMDQDLAYAALPIEEVMGAIVYVVAGTANGGTFWRNTNTTAPTLGTTALTFVQFGGGSSLTVDDDGTPLATAATVLDFVGAGVVASGTGATKTITVSGAPTGAAGGDLSGTYPNPAVAKINGAALGTTTGAAVGDRLRWNGTAWAASSLIWQPLTDPSVPDLIFDTGTGDVIMVEA